VESSTTRVYLRVSAGAGRPGIRGRYGEAWKVRVAAPLERGKANDALLTLLADTLEVPRRNLQIVTGTRARDKIVALEGLSQHEADTRLALAADAGRDRGR
jgi:uncharacterized protein YggU (UPF0235/DUF167 family)